MVSVMITMKTLTRRLSTISQLLLSDLDIHSFKEPSSECPIKWDYIYMLYIELIYWTYLQFDQPKKKEGI